jgi:hypothetical protein
MSTILVNIQANAAELKDSQRLSLWGKVVGGKLDIFKLSDRQRLRFALKVWNYGD